MTPRERIAEIDKMDVEQLLRLVRFEPIGSPWCQEQVGTRLMEKLAEKRDEDPEAYTAASKLIGW